MSELAVSRIPQEIWSRIAYFLPRMSGQPRWQAWVMHRTLNKIFKEAIEEYYIKHYLEETGIRVECEDRFENGADQSFYALFESYAFAGFADPEQRIAVIKTCDKKASTSTREFEVCFS